MPLVVTDEGEIFLLDLLLKVALATPENWVLRLFKSDSVIDSATTLASVTEADYDGYDPLDLTRADWSDAATVGERATSSWGIAPVYFVADSGTQNIYGWYVTDAANTLFLFGSRLAGAPVEVSTTNPVPLTPTMRLSSEYVPA